MVSRPKGVNYHARFLEGKGRAISRPTRHETLSVIAKKRSLRMIKQPIKLMKMKKQILICLILLSSVLTMNAQIYTPSGTIQGTSGNNNVGIGINSPSASFHIRTATANLLVENAGIEGAYMTVHSGRFNRPALTVYKQAGTVYWNTGILYDEGGNQKYSIGITESLSSSKLTIQANGNTGIGTINPQAKLQIGNLGGADKRIMIPGSYNFEQLNLSMGANGNGELEFVTHSNGESSGGVKLYSPDGAHLFIQTASPVTSYTSLNYETRLSIMNNTGFVGIGTISPQYKLDVIGTIRAREIKVDLNGADFVFEKDYRLMPLDELEKFVKEQKHLPEVAPAKEMKENGTDLGDLNSKLLQKVEEMTLYIIEQNKELQVLKEKIAKLESASK